MMHKGFQVDDTFLLQSNTIVSMELLFGLEINFVGPMEIQEYFTSKLMPKVNKRYTNL